VTTALDLGRVAPNFTAQRAAQAANVRVTIRGIGAAGNTATEPSVATFLDGAYVPRTASVINGFLDIEGVEILRGPQGTLFGRNASVGALSLRSAAPKQDFSASVTAEAASADRYSVNGVVNLPVSDQLAVRFAGQARWFKGYHTNTLNNSRFGESDELAGRFSAKADFGAVTWIGRADYSRTKGDGLANIDFDGRSVSVAQLNALRTRLGGQLPDTNLSDRKANHVLVGALNDKHWGFSSTLEAGVGGGFNVKLINAYRDWDSVQTDGDVVFLPVALTNRTGGYRSQSQNHELQLISPVGEFAGGALDFVGGLYYFTEDFKIDEKLHLVGQYCNLLVANLAQRATCNNLIATGAGENASDQDFSQKLKSFAAYSQFNINLSDQFTVVVGGRWTKEKKDAFLIQRVPNTFALTSRAPENVAFKIDDDRFTYRIGANFKPSRDFLLFGSFSTGFKSAGINSGGGSTALNQRRKFGRETVKNYEVGVKSQWLDRALTANFTLYRMNIAGYQDRSFDGTSFIVRNAGELRHQGVELDLVAKPSRAFRLNAAIAYLDSEFTSYLGASALPGLGAAATQNLTGGSAHFAPKWTGNVGMEWRADVGGSGMQLVTSASVNFLSDQFAGAVTDNNPQVVQDGYALLGGRIGVEGPSNRWSLSLYGRNLTNKAYAVAKFYQPLAGAFGLNNGVFPGSTAVRQQRAEPRSYGVTATVRF
jgi:iron complex outermembrane recepter protein